MQINDEITQLSIDMFVGAGAPQNMYGSADRSMVALNWPSSIFFQSNGRDHTTELLDSLIVDSTDQVVLSLPCNCLHNRD